MKIPAVQKGRTALTHKQDNVYLTEEMALKVKPYVIGITGNIASGKSVVSQYLQNMRVFCIDADILAQRAMAKGTPGYKQVIQVFGSAILDKKQHIDRQALARIVFTDPQRLTQLEECIHPLVKTAIAHIIAQCQSPIVAVEAIKLFEAGMAAHCDSVWTAAADDQVRLQRLLDERKMSFTAAQARLDAQPPQAEKIAKSDVTIHTDGSFEQTCDQVRSAFLSAFGNVKHENRHYQLTEDLSLRQLYLSDSPALADFWEAIRGKKPENEQLSRQFGKHAFWAVFSGENLLHLLTLKQRIGIAYIKDMTSLGQIEEAIPSLLPNLCQALKFRMQQEWVEILAYNPAIMSEEMMKLTGGSAKRIANLHYAYRSILLQVASAQHQVITFRLIKTGIFNKIFHF